MPQATRQQKDAEPLQPEAHDDKLMLISSCVHVYSNHTALGGGFKYLLFFHSDPGDIFPIRLILFDWAETTNYI